MALKNRGPFRRDLQRRVDHLRQVVRRQNLGPLHTYQLSEDRTLAAKRTAARHLKTHIPGPDDNEIRKGRTRAQSRALSRNKTGLMVLLLGAKKPGLKRCGA